MRALFFDKELKYRDDLTAPRPRNDEALIKVTCAGICNTDLEIIKGYMGFKGIPGHEFVGIVEECGNKELVGKRVVGEINIGCGRCNYCRSGLQNHCPERSVLGILNREGAFADHIVLPVDNLHVIPDSVSDEEAVFVEPLAAGFEILQQVDIGTSDRVCLIGDGKLGLLIAQVLSLTGCDLTVVGNHRSKLLILGELGIRTELSSEFTGKDMDMVIECSGSGSGMETALKTVRPRGKIIIKTTIAERGHIDLNRVVINELSLIGSRCGPFPEAINAIGSGKVKLSPLISAEYSIVEGVRAFAHASERGALKVILKFN
jgi:threonine dehydrogenase-like Zn-dependent dehydrogenase